MANDSENNNQKNPVQDLSVIHDPLSTALDLYHHDQPERHSFGLAFHNPVDPQPVGTVAFPGVSDTPAREDHVHAAGSGGGGGTPATSVTTQAVGDVPVVGTSTNYARQDHKHGMPGFGTVVAEPTFGSASSDGTSVNIAHSDHQHGNPVHDAAAHSTIPISALATALAAINMGSQKIINLLDPTNPQDAATKLYVDTAVANATPSLSWKQTVRCYAAANIALSGIPSSGLTDGVTVVAGDRVLVNNQSTVSQNGIYVASAGAWTRATDCDTGAKMLGGATLIQEGTTYHDSIWVCTTDAPITIGSTTIAWAQIAGPNLLTVGNGLIKTGGYNLSVNPGTGVTFVSGAVTVDTSIIPRKFAGALVGTASPETITHNLNTRDITVAVYNGSAPYTAVSVDWDATTVNTVTIRYNPNLGAGYRIVVHG